MATDKQVEDFALGNLGKIPDDVFCSMFDSMMSLALSGKEYTTEELLSTLKEAGEPDAEQK